MKIKDFQLFKFKEFKHNQKLNCKLLGKVILK